MTPKFKSKSKENFSEVEAAQRFDAALRGAFSTPPTAMKDLPRKRPKIRRKPSVKSKASA